jgi:hypothetical protein
MKIKKEYHNRVITVNDPFIPGGVKHRLGDLKSYEVRNLYRQGLISDDILEPKKETPKRKKNDTRKDNGNEEGK